jgi:hypothetical protein
MNTRGRRLSRQGIGAEGTCCPDGRHCAKECVHPVAGRHLRTGGFCLTQAFCLLGLMM